MGAEIGGTRQNLVHVFNVIVIDVRVSHVVFVRRHKFNVPGSAERQKGCQAICERLGSTNTLAILIFATPHSTDTTRLAKRTIAMEVALTTMVARR